MSSNNETPPPPSSNGNAGERPHEQKVFMWSPAAESKRCQKLIGNVLEDHGYSLDSVIGGGKISNIWLGKFRASKRKVRIGSIKIFLKDPYIKRRWNPWNCIGTRPDTRHKMRSRSYRYSFWSTSPIGQRFVLCVAHVALCVLASVQNCATHCASVGLHI